MKTFPPLPNLFVAPPPSKLLLSAAFASEGPRGACDRHVLEPPGHSNSPPPPHWPGPLLGPGRGVATGLLGGGGGRSWDSWWLAGVSVRGGGKGVVTPTETNVHGDALCFMLKTWAIHKTRRN